MPQFPHLQNRDSSYKYHQTIEGKILKLSDFAISILDKLRYGREVLSVVIVKSVTDQIAKWLL